MLLKQVALDAYNQISETWPAKQESPESVKISKSKRLSLSGSQISALSSGKGNPGLKSELVETSLKGVPSGVLKVYTAVMEHTVSVACPRVGPSKPHAECNDPLSS